MAWKWMYIFEMVMQVNLFSDFGHLGKIIGAEKSL